MKRILFFLFCITTIVACSDENVGSNDGEGANPNITGNYFPATVNDYWKYDITSTSTNNGTSEVLVSNDSLYVATGNASVFSLGVNDNMVANGSTNGLLISGELTKTDTTLSLDGNLALPPELSDLVDFEITLTNVVLYNINAVSGTELSSNSNTIQQDFNGFPITINYNFTTKAKGFLETASLGGDTYANVSTTDLILNLSVTTSITVGPTTIDLDILEAQDVLVSTNYFAENIGLVNASTNTSYEISATAVAALEAAGVPLTIPTSGSTNNTQVLTDYSVTE